MDELHHHAGPLERLLVAVDVALLPDLLGLLVVRVLLEVAHGLAELHGLDLRVEEDGAEEHGGGDEGRAPAQPAPHVDVLQHPLHHRRWAVAELEPHGLEVADALGHVEDVRAVDDVRDGRVHLARHLGLRDGWKRFCWGVRGGGGRVLDLRCVGARGCWCWCIGLVGWCFL